MEQTKCGVVYIIYNPAFPSWVKIGYTDNLENRLNDFNHSDCVPFAFRAYAICEVDKRLADKDIHKIFDTINPELRSRDKHENGKERVREFFNIEPENAFQVLLSVSNFFSNSDRVKRIEPTPTEQEEEKEATSIRQSEILRTEFWSKFEKYYKSRDNFFNSVNMANCFTWSSRTLNGNEFIFYVTNKSISVKLKAKQDVFARLNGNRSEIDKKFSVVPIWDIANKEIKIERTDLHITKQDSWQTIFEFMTITMIELKNCMELKK